MLHVEGLVYYCSNTKKFYIHLIQHRLYGELMNFVSESNPSLEQAQEIASNSVQYKSLLTILAKCKVDYTGRTSSFLPTGDRLILRKPDGTILVHTDKGREPINWQPPGATLQVQLNNDKLVLLSIRTSPRESIEIEIENIATITSINLAGNQEKESFGSEADLQDYLVSNPDDIERGFTFVEKERSIKVGSIDIFGRDSEGVPVIVEIKRRKAGPDAVQQLRRYVESYDSERVRGVLVAPELSDSAEYQVNNYSFKHVEIPDGFHDIDSSTVTGQFTSLGEF